MSFAALHNKCFTHIFTLYWESPLSLILTYLQYLIHACWQADILLYFHTHTFFHTCIFYLHTNIYAHLYNYLHTWRRITSSDSSTKCSNKMHTFLFQKLRVCVVQILSPSGIYSRFILISKRFYQQSVTKNFFLVQNNDGCLSNEWGVKNKVIL